MSAETRPRMSEADGPDYRYIEAVVRSLGDFRAGPQVQLVRNYERNTHTKTEQEKIGEACLRGLVGSVKSAAFLVKATRKKTGWRIKFFIHERTA